MNDVLRWRERYLIRIQTFIARMPSLSTTAIKVLETCNDPHASANDLKRVISLDPVLTGRVLKLINSAYYSIRRPITSLTRAIIMLGLNTVKNLALSFAILENFRSKGRCRAFSNDEFWTHSLCAGVTARSLAAFKAVSPSEREEYFIAGLLHDLGKIPLHTQLPQEYQAVWEATERDRDSLHLSEAKLLGFDHCAVGKMIAEKWRLGETLIESLLNHHHPEDCSEKNRFFVSIIAMADQFTNHSKIGSAGNRFEDPALIARLIEELEIDWTILDDSREVVLSEIEKAKIFLEIAQKG